MQLVTRDAGVQVDARRRPTLLGRNAHHGAAEIRRWDAANRLTFDQTSTRRSAGAAAVR